MFGTDGGVMITLYANFPDDFQTKEPLFVVIDKLAVPLFCTSLERRGQAGAIIPFDDIVTVRRAEEYLVGRELLIEEGEDDDDEFYMEDLIGFSVEVGKLRGEVTDFYDSEMNPLLGIDFSDGERLIPAAEEFIVRIDFERKKMKIILPEGLLEI